MGSTSHPAERNEEAAQILAYLRPALSRGALTPPDSAQDALRRRAWGVVERLLRSAIAALSAHLHDAQAPQTEAKPTEEDERQRLAGLIHAAARELSVASGAWEERQPPSEDGDQTAAQALAMKQRFYRDAEAVLDEFIAAAAPGHTPAAHEIVQTLVYLVEADPASILLRIRDLLRAAAAGGYQYEALAVDKVIDGMERYLADYRAILWNRPACRTAFREILDLFVLAGWPRALRFVYRFREIDR